MKTPAPPHRAARLVLVLVSCLVVTEAIARADVNDHPRPKPSQERRPNVFERVGNFFYNLANRIERSDIPDYPGRAPTTSGRYPVMPPSKSAPVPGQHKPGAVDPANRSKTAPPDIYSSNRYGSAYRTPPTPAGKVTPPPSERTAPLPDAATAGTDKKSTGPSRPDSSPQGNATGASAKIAGQSQKKGDDYPAGTPTRKMNRVKSPYPPFTELDVTGLLSGSLAKDPVTGQIFRVP